MKTLLTLMLFSCLTTSIAQQSLNQSDYPYPMDATLVTETKKNYYPHNNTWKEFVYKKLEFKNGKLIADYTNYGGYSTDSYKLKYDASGNISSRMYLRTGTKSDGRYDYTYTTTGTNPVTIIETKNKDRDCEPKIVRSFNPDGSVDTEDYYNEDGSQRHKILYFPNMTIYERYSDGKLWQKRIKSHKKGLLVEDVLYDKDDKVLSTETFKYKKGLVQSAIKTDSKGDEKKTTFTHYTKDGLKLATIEVGEGYDKKPEFTAYLYSYTLKDGKRAEIARDEEQAILDKLLAKAKKENGIKE